MRLALYSSLFFGFLTALNADIIDEVATPTGLDSIHYSFTLSGFDLLQYEVLDLQFDPSKYSLLSGALAPPGFSTAIDPVNSPPGAPGDFLVEALTSNPTLTPVSLGVDAQLTGTGELGPLPFSVFQFDAKGQNEGLVASGKTTDRDVVPEPTGVSLPVLGLLAACILGSRWHRNRGWPSSRIN